MADNDVEAAALPTTTDTSRREPMPRPSLVSQLMARLRADRLDRLIAVGVPAAAGSAQAAHEARLVSTAERETIARSLRTAAADARGRGLLLSSRVPLHVPNITAAGDMIDAVTLRLHSPGPVSARGMARLRQILSDGTGPMYRYGRGDLRGRLGAALAAL
ncbi:hypothetical protein MycrhN_4848 [Mycolicibacterium rhodesiae NBB3]|jgi:hypothetical protein|uniref:Uncharacterized protein n=1 Tax=Mycolicibacterium rhodesiae (strain NBB3) TaxID=710685 RepID=G8RTF5_MYCRN|nr:hypothetical protein [Mycolicibacterium rhodesiae]AEV75329.1 hypothetical protein MycrhN_4848 [Mycolicibacterium rhodesiae NBB3]